MPFQITTTVDCYLLPDDGVAARALFLEHLKDPNEMWIIAYSFTLAPMIDEIIANNAAATPIHIYLDFSQSSGRAEAQQVQRLVAGGVEVTIGTSPAGTRYICHTKGIVCNDKPQPFCWEGSVNFSESGWHQVNTAMIFHSAEYRDAFVNQFNHLRYFAWTQEREKQLLPQPPAGALTPPADLATLGGLYATLPANATAAAVGGTARKNAAPAKKSIAKKVSTRKKKT